MGLYHEVFMGAGFIMPEIKETRKVKRKSCGDKTHPNHGQFCTRCGQQIKEIEADEEFNVSAMDIVGDNRLCGTYHTDDDVAIYTSNMQGISEQMNANEYGVLTAETIDSYILDFKEEHKSDIEMIEKRLGEKIKIEFFVIHDYS